MRPIHIRPDGPGVVVPSDVTDGAYAIVEQRMKPRQLIHGHVHERTDIWIYVLAGEVGIRVEDREAIGRPGDYLIKPKGVRHAMWNPGDEPNHLIEILMPGDHDAFFKEAPDTPPDEFEAMSARHGIHWFDDWTDELKDKYGLE
jgi:quercetin dioxygenase-like cupin family protein